MADKTVGFFKWASIIRRSNLPTMTKTVALIIGLHADTATGANIYTGRECFAREAGVDVKTVSRHMKDLKRHGLLRQQSGGGHGKNAVYQLTASADLIEEVERLEAPRGKSELWSAYQVRKQRTLESHVPTVEEAKQRTPESHEPDETKDSRVPKQRTPESPIPVHRPAPPLRLAFP